jgi:hypothetical protein
MGGNSASAGAGLGMTRSTAEGIESGRMHCTETRNADKSHRAAVSGCRALSQHDPPRSH